MRLTALVAALSLAGCASFGPTISHSDGAGYARPSYGVLAKAEGSVGRLEARYLSVEKRDGGEGTALVASALWRGIEREPVSFLVGPEIVRQHVERYDANRTSIRVEFDLHRRYGLYYVSGDRKIKQIYGVRGEWGKGRVRLLTELEWANHTQGDAKRVAISLLARPKGK